MEQEVTKGITDPSQLEVGMAYTLQCAFAHNEAVRRGTKLPRVRTLDREEAVRRIHTACPKRRQQVDEAVAEYLARQKSE